MREDVECRASSVPSIRLGQIIDGHVSADEPRTHELH